MFLYHHWLELPLSTRIKIAMQFGITKKGSTHVVDNVIQSDGFLVKDVEQSLNVDAIQTYLDTEVTDLKLLWDMLVAKIEGRVLFEPATATMVTGTPMPLETMTATSSTLPAKKKTKNVKAKK